MVVDTSTVRLTYEDYCDLPDDGKLYELIDGNLDVTPAPATKHQIVVMNLSYLLEHWRRQTGDTGRLLTSPVDVLLSRNDVVQPDLIYLTSENRSRLTEQYIEGPPDLVIEVLSEHHRRRDEVVKLHLYERSAVAEYWIVDPELETTKVHRLDDQGHLLKTAELSAAANDTLASPLFPGLDLRLKDLFANPV